MLAELFVLHLITVTGGNGEIIAINPAEIASVRVPGPVKEHFHKSVKCLIFTADGKFITAQETCEKINDLIENSKP